MTRAFRILITVISMFCFLSTTLNAQSPSLTIGSVGICTSPTILIPLTGTNMTNIGSLTIFINFDNQSLVFDSVKNINPQLNGLLFNLVSNPSRLAIVWSNVNGANFQNNTLLNLKFTVLQQNSAISFAPGCEIASVSLQVLPVNYINGGVYPSAPIITANPENKTVKSQANAVFQVASSNASAYLWQESRNGGISWTELTDGTTYTGTHTAVFTVNHVPTLFNQFAYRCIVKKDNCPATTNQATLSVDSVSGVYEQGLKNTLHIYNTPNPFSESTTLNYTVPSRGNVSINILSSLGKCMVKIINSEHLKGTYKLEENFVSLPSGIYTCQYIFTSSGNSFVTETKMIKINQ